MLEVSNGGLQDVRYLLDSSFGLSIERLDVLDRLVA